MNDHQPETVETCAVCDTEWDTEAADECPECGSTKVWDMGAAFDAATAPEPEANDD